MELSAIANERVDSRSSGWASIDPDLEHKEVMPAEVRARTRQNLRFRQLLR